MKLWIQKICVYTLMSMFAEIPDAFDSADFNRLGLLAERGVDGAADIISLVAELRGISSDVEENRENLDMALQQLAETPLACTGK
jgi:hypothetical protein